MRRLIAVRLGPAALALGVLLTAGACGPTPGRVNPSVTLVPADRVITPAPSVVPSPTATALPDAEAAAAAVTAYAKLVAKPSLSFHETGTATDYSGDGIVKIKLALDVAGADFGGTATLGKKALRVAYLHGNGWVKLKDTGWASFPVQVSAFADLARPWGYMCWLNDLEYTGPAAKQPDAFAYECTGGWTFQTPRMRSYGLIAHVDRLELVLARDGTPVSMRVEGTYPEIQGQAAGFKAELAFSGVGKPVKIAAPK
jgi:hypothetical protein